MKMTFVAGAKENALPFSTLEDAQVSESSAHTSYSPRRLSSCCVLFSEHAGCNSRSATFIEAFVSKPGFWKKYLLKVNPT
jgi:hypothetical protein